MSGQWAQIWKGRSENKKVYDDTFLLAPIMVLSTYTTPFNKPCQILHPEPIPILDNGTLLDSERLARRQRLSAEIAAAFRPLSCPSLAKHLVASCFQTRAMPSACTSPFDPSDTAGLVKGRPAIYETPVTNVA
jgi:hypothetical protein